MQLPHGWAYLDASGQWAYEIANPQNRQPITAFASQQYQAPMTPQYGAPPGPPPLQGYQPPPPQTFGGGYPSPPTQPQQQAYGGYQPPQGPPQYGGPQQYGLAQNGALPAFATPTNIDDYLNQQETQRKAAYGNDRETNFIWIDHEKLNSVGQESVLTLRLLPDFMRGPDGQPRNPPVISVVNSRHRMFTSYMPGDQQGQFRYLSCLNQPVTGPGDCPICKAVEMIRTGGKEGAAEHIDNCRVQVSSCWQVIDLDNPSAHYVQEFDKTTGQPLLDQMGQPRWKMVPGVFRMKKKAQDALHSNMRHVGDPTHPQFGYPVRIVAKKTGKEQMNVEHHVMALDKSPIDPALYPICHNAIDLLAEMSRFNDRAWLQQIADAMLQKNMGPSRGQAQVPGNYGGGGYQPPPSFVGQQGAPAGNQWGAQPPPARPGWGQGTPPAAPPQGPPAGPPPYPHTQNQYPAAFQGSGGYQPPPPQPPPLSLPGAQSHVAALPPGYPAGPTGMPGPGPMQAGGAAPPNVSNSGTYQPGPPQGLPPGFERVAGGDKFGGLVPNAPPQQPPMMPASLPPPAAPGLPPGFGQAGQAPPMMGGMMPPSPPPPPGMPPGVSAHQPPTAGQQPQLPPPGPGATLTPEQLEAQLGIGQGKPPF